MPPGSITSLWTNQKVWHSFQPNTEVYTEHWIWWCVFCSDLLSLSSRMTEIYSDSNVWGHRLPVGEVGMFLGCHEGHLCEERFPRQWRQFSRMWIPICHHGENNVKFIYPVSLVVECCSCTLSCTAVHSTVRLFLCESCFSGETRGYWLNACLSLSYVCGLAALWGWVLPSNKPLDLMLYMYVHVYWTSDVAEWKV